MPSGLLCHIARAPPSVRGGRLSRRARLRPVSRCIRSVPPEGSIVLVRIDQLGGQYAPSARRTQTEKYPCAWDPIRESPRTLTRTPIVETVWNFLRTRQPPNHQPRHRCVNECLSGGAQPLLVFGHPTVVADPREGTLHHPSSRGSAFGLTYNLHAQAHRLLGPPFAPPLVAGVDPQMREAREPDPRRLQQQPDTIPLGDPGAVYLGSTVPMIFAARMGPMSKISVRVLPEAFWP
jgi:hypothetical protein